MIIYFVLLKRNGIELCFKREPIFNKTCADWFLSPTKMEFHMIFIKHRHNKTSIVRVLSSLGMISLLIGVIVE